MLKKILIRNIGTSVLLKIFSVMLQLYSVALLLKVMTPSSYGIWVTIQSVATWFSLVDFGITGGLRNKLTGSLAREDNAGAIAYVSSVFFGQLLLFMTFLATLAYPVLYADLSWLSDSWNYENTWEFRLCLFLAITAMLASQCLGVSNTVLIAKQWSSLTAIAPFAAVLLQTMWVVYYSTSSQISISQLALVNLLCVIIAYSTQCLLVFASFPNLVPRPNRFRLLQFKETTVLGSKFFLIQIAFLMIFCTDRLIIASYLGPVDASLYDVTYRLFSISTMISVILLNPVSALTCSAWETKKIELLRKITLFTMAVITVAGIVSVFTAFCAGFVVNRFFSAELNLSCFTTICFLLYSMVVVWNSGFALLLNSTGQTKEQMYTSVFAATLNVPLSIAFCTHVNLGVTGVVLASTISLLPFAIVGPMTWRRLIREQHPSIASAS